jgi:hypothetical protein
MELATDTDKATKFINGIIPAKFRNESALPNHPVIENA